MTLVQPTNKQQATTGVWRVKGMQYKKNCKIDSIQCEVPQEILFYSKTLEIGFVRAIIYGIYIDMHIQGKISIKIYNI